MTGTIKDRMIASSEIKSYVGEIYSKKIKGVQLDLFGEKVKIVADSISEKRNFVLSESEILAIAKAIELRLDFDITNAEQSENSIKHFLLMERQLKKIYFILYGAFSRLKREFGILRNKDVTRISCSKKDGERYRKIFLNSINSLVLFLKHWDGVPEPVSKAVRNEIERWAYLAQHLGAYQRGEMMSSEFRAELVRFDRALNQNWITLLFEDDLLAA